ncbi:glycosyltransferase [Williamsia sterculiae]|uniref:Predicted glycosyl transferase n=1 Tax=Williamsia sterculiae TaxID=1344003 RepID=A0A1N7EPJ5_9NOCA|nr:glycosyltransferase [Williamsia sterculiae]SIR89990.1 Predicted glycosyl transferase [Williamsia sterculiae]
MIGYYVHHQGSGHMMRSHSIAASLDEPVTVLSSRRPQDGHAAGSWLPLPLDVPDPPDATVRAPSAHDTLHWAPIDVPGLTERMGIIADWIRRTRPSVVVVDVSVEVALFVRTMGIPVVIMAMPGVRDDPPHLLAHRLADAIVAPWSADLYRPAHLHPFDDTTHYVGAISRFDGRARCGRADGDAPVVILGGAGGSIVTDDDVAAARATTPGRRWVAAGVAGSGWVDDVWPLLCSASVIVTHAGQNAIADVACAGAAAVVTPQRRPFGEQDATAEALRTHEVACVTRRWPEPSSWPDVLHRAESLDRLSWRRLQVEGAARRAAAVIADVAAR